MIIVKENVKAKHDGHSFHYNAMIANSLQEVEKAEVPTAYNATHWDECCYEYRGKDWYGVSGGYREFKRVAREGYPAGVEAVRKLATQLQGKLQKPKVMRRKRTKGDAGDEVDIHAVNMGSLDRAWTRTQRAPRMGKKKITLLVQVGAQGSVHADRMFWGPVSALLLAEELVKARYAVEIIAVQPAGGVYPTMRNRLYLGLIKLKHFSQPLNLNSLSMMTLGGFHRYFGFKLRLISRDRVDEGMGYTMGIKDPQIQAMVMDQMPSGTNPIFIDRINSEREAVYEVNRIFEQVQKEGQQVAA